MEAFVVECFLGFAHKFQALVIYVSTYNGGNFMGDWVGSPNPYSYVPDEFIEYPDKMNFWERTHNTIVCFFKHVGRQLIHMPKQNAAMQKYFNYTDNLPPVWELEYKTSLVLLNTHHSLSYPKPLMPNYVQVGGMHVKPPKKLPQVRVDILHKIQPNLPFLRFLCLFRLLSYYFLRFVFVLTFYITLSFFRFQTVL
jgi:glucuronosyltransferase